MNIQEFKDEIIELFDYIAQEEPSEELLNQIIEVLKNEKTKTNKINKINELIESEIKDSIDFSNELATEIVRKSSQINLTNESVYEKYLAKVYEEDLFSLTKNLINNTSELALSSSYIAKKLNQIFSPKHLTLVNGQLYDSQGDIKAILSDNTSIEFQYFPDEKSNFIKVIDSSGRVIRFLTNAFKKASFDILDELEEGWRQLKRKYKL